MNWVNTYGDQVKVRAAQALLLHRFPIVASFSYQLNPQGVSNCPGLHRTCSIGIAWAVLDTVHRLNAVRQDPSERLRVP